MVLTFRLGSWATEFSSGFGSQIVVLSFGLGSRSIAVSSWRSEEIEIDDGRMGGTSVLSLLAGD